jgi:hypothetical protein
LQTTIDRGAHLPNQPTDTTKVPVNAVLVRMDFKFPSTRTNRAHVSVQADTRRSERPSDLSNPRTVRAISPLCFQRAALHASRARLAFEVPRFVYETMRNHPSLFLLVVVMSASLSAQEVPAGHTPAPVGQMMGERDKAKEDQVAKMFETIRADAKLPPLGRITHRDSLEQKVCTFVLSGSLPKLRLSNTSALYITPNPETVSAELKHVASFNDLRPKYNPSIERYSVAVWKVRNSQTGETTFWVGLQLYWSAAAEFFDSHFTDDLYYRNEWKKSVAPQCRGK